MSSLELSVEIRAGWTPQQAGMLEFVAKGASISAAAAALGIARSTVYVWRNVVPGFADALKQAEGIAEVNYTIQLHKAASEDWRAAQFWLSRRRRELYGDNIDIDIDTRINRLLAKLEQSGKAETAVGSGAEGNVEGEGVDNPLGPEDSGQVREPDSADNEPGPASTTP